MAYSKRFLLSLLAIILVFEEWLWELLTGVGSFLSRVLHLARVESWLSAAPRYVALIAFAIPVCIVLPLNIIVLEFLAHGFIIKAIITEIIAKLVGILLVARIFALTKNQLMSFNWFVVVYTTIIRWLYWAHTHIAMMPIYQAAKACKEKIRAFFT